MLSSVPVRTAAVVATLLASLGSISAAPAALASSCSTVDPAYIVLTQQITAKLGSVVSCAAPVGGVGPRVQQLDNGILFAWDDGSIDFEANSGEHYEWDGTSLWYSASPDADAQLVSGAAAGAQAPVAATQNVAPSTPSTGSVPVWAATAADMAKAGTQLKSSPASVPVGTWECRAGYNWFSGRLYILDASHYRTSDSNPQVGTYTFDPSTRQVNFHGGNWSEFRAEYEAPGDVVQKGVTDGPMLYMTGSDEPGSHLAATMDVLKSCGWRSTELYDLP